MSDKSKTTEQHRSLNALVRFFGPDFIRVEHWTLFSRQRLKQHFAGIKVFRIKFMIGWTTYENN